MYIPEDQRQFYILLKTLHDQGPIVGNRLREALAETSRAVFGSVDYGQVPKPLPPFEVQVGPGPTFSLTDFGKEIYLDIEKGPQQERMGGLLAQLSAISPS